MKTKPIWGLWLLMIVAPIAVFLGVNYWKSLPPKTQIPVSLPMTYLPPGMSSQEANNLTLPYFGKAYLVTRDKNKHTYAIEWQMPSHTRNHKFSFWIVKGANEFLSKPSDNHLFTHEGNGPGKAAVQFHLKKDRKHSVILRLNWELNEKQGVRNYEITP